MSCGAALLLLAADGLRAEPAGWLPPVVGAQERIAADPRTGLGLGGLDPVSYQLDGRPRPGSSAHELRRGGLVWRFASAANRDAFARDPESFLPRVGGHDAYAAARGRIVDADPAIFHVLQGRLYLFRTAENRHRFLVDAASPLKAEAGWLRLAGTLVQE